jgi:hypothetical protein
MNPWPLAAPSSGFINADVDLFVTSPSHNASPNQALAGTPDATATRDQHIPIWSPSTTNNVWNNEWNPDVTIALPAGNPASLGLAQSLSHVTPEPFTPAWGLADMYSNAIENGQPGPTLQFPDVGVYNDSSATPNGFGNPASDLFAQSLSHVTSGFGQRSSADSPPAYSNAIEDVQPDPTLHFLDLGVYNGVMPNGFGNSTSYTQWDDLTAINSPETMTGFNQLFLPTTTSMPAAPALPTHATNTPAAPAMPRPIARRVTSRRSNVNTNAHICSYCGKMFARPGDLARHSKQHGVPQHPCDIPGCNRHGLRAFYRADKLLEHQRKKHGRGN